MLSNIITHLNWVLILMILMVTRICYVGIKNGLPAEFFKLLGVLCATYLASHYFTVISDFISERFNTSVLPLDFLDFLIFVLIVLATHLIFLVLREAFARFIKMEAVPKINKIGGFILSLARGLLWAGLISFMLVISTVGYLKQSVKNSFSGSRLFKVTPITYSWLWNNVMSKFMTQEKFNDTINEIQENFNK